MNESFLRSMYQQWQDGQNEYINRWEDFVKLAAHQQSISVDQMTKILKYYNWFKFN